MKTLRRTLVHLLAGRESTHCGSGQTRPAFTTHDLARVTCERCLAANRRANGVK